MPFLGLDQRFRLSVPKFKLAQSEVCPVGSSTPVQEASVVELSECVSKPSFPVNFHVYAARNINHIKEVSELSDKIQVNKTHERRAIDDGGTQLVLREGRK